MDPFKDAASGFRELYNVVTWEMQRFRDVSLAGQVANQRWLDDLIAGFEARYQTWNPPPTEQQGGEIVKALRVKGVKDVARLCGFAYLHICLDLPVVISQSLPRPAVGLGDARSIYLRLGPVLEDVYADTIKEGRNPGVHVLMRYAARIEPQAMRVMGYWVIMLRTAAWMHADNHRDLPPAQQADYELELARALRQAVDKALKLKWYRMLSALPVPVISIVGAVWVVGAVMAPGSAWAVSLDLALETSTVLGITLGLIAGLLVAWRYIYRRLQVSWVNAFGVLVHRAISEVGVDRDTWRSVRR
jgi:hypothetical protein